VPQWSDDLVGRLEAAAWLDGAADVLTAGARRVIPPGPARDVLRGAWLGHPLHPMLTDLPIGFWTSSFVLDLFGPPAAPTSDVLLGLGVLSAAPTAAAGLTDLADVEDPATRRIGTAHAAANVVTVALYALAWVARRRQRRVAGLVWSTAGATTATVAGYLGGHLVFRRAAGVDAGPGDR
jgi:uncharacterized membrane protein